MSDLVKYTNDSNTITVNSGDGVRIDSTGRIIFHEFSQAQVDINYISTVPRAKTAFVIAEMTGNAIVQSNYRNNVVPIANGSSTLFTGGSAAVILQSQVGRTSNIARGIVGAVGLRPIGDFTVKIDIFGSATPGAQPTVLSQPETLTINGRITQLFQDPLIIAISEDSNDATKTIYDISLSDADEAIAGPFLYGYKISGISAGVILKKGASTLKNGDIIQSSNGILQLKSTGSNSGTIAFSIVAVDLDKQVRPATLSSVNIFKFDSSLVDFDAGKGVISYPNVRDYVAASGLNPAVTRIPGFLMYSNNTTTRINTGTGTMSIWSDSASTQFDITVDPLVSTEGIVKFVFPSTVPVTDSTFKYTVTAGLNGDIPSIRENIVTVNGNSLVNGVYTGSAVFNRNNLEISLDIKSVPIKSGTFVLSYSVSHGSTEQTVGSPLNFRVIENAPEPKAVAKRVYLFDNTVDYIIDPTFDDSSSWANADIPVDGSSDVIISKLISDSSANKFNLNYKDENKASAVNDSGNLGLYVDLSTITTTLQDPTNTFQNKLKFHVNPTTYATVKASELSKALWVSNGLGTKTTVLIANADAPNATTKKKVTTTVRNLAINGADKFDNNVSDVVTVVEVANSNPVQTNGSTTTYNYAIKNNNIKIVCNGYYGKVILTYQISDGTKQSFNSVNSDLYIMPRAKPVVELKRMLENQTNGSITQTTKVAFSKSDDFIKYALTVKNGLSGTDYDYTVGESNAIAAYLKSKQNLIINYNNVVSLVKLDGREQRDSSLIQFERNKSDFYVNRVYNVAREAGMSAAIENAINNAFSRVLSNGKYSAPLPTVAMYNNAMAATVAAGVNQAVIDGNLGSSSASAVIAAIKAIVGFPVDITTFGSILDSPTVGSLDGGADGAAQLNAARARIAAASVLSALNTFDLVASIVTNIPTAVANLPYTVNNCDVLPWLGGVTSTGMFSFEPRDAGAYIIKLTGKFTSTLTPVADVDSANDAVQLYLSNETVANSILANEIKILGVPVIKGFEVNNDVSLLAAVVGGYRNLAVGSCSVVVIKNIAEINGSDIKVKVTDFNGNTSAPIYLNTTASDITIAPGKSRVFIRIMYSPEAWEPMAVDYP